MTDDSNNNSNNNLISVFDEYENYKKIHENELTEEELIEEDYEYTKKIIKRLINDSEDVLENAKDIAIETGEPRTIDAYNALLRTVGNLANDIMGNSVEKSKAVKNRRTSYSNPNQMRDSQRFLDNNSNNNSQTAAIFVGSTAELLKMIKNEEKKSHDIVVENNESTNQ